MRTLRPSFLAIFLSSFIFSSFIQAQTNLLTVDFETDGAGYSPSTATGSGFTDLFNRTDANLSASNETGFYWGMEDFDGTQTIVIDQVDVTGFSAFNFSLDWVTHHTNDWDAGSYVHITYTLDGGSTQNLLWVETVPNGTSRTNEPAAVDINFDGDGECANSLPALSTATNGCDIGANRGDFETYLTSDISLPSGASALVITIEFNDMNQTDQGIYLDNILINGVGAASTAEMDYYNLQWPANGTIDVGGSFTAFAQGYEDGVTTTGNNPGTGVECWIGYSTTDASTTADFDGAGWTWVPASFSSQQGNNNEFSVDFGSGISTSGTYYYVSRWSLENGPYTYGGFQNAWNGTSVPSGVLTVNDVTMDYANLQSPQTGSITVSGNFDVYAQGYEPGVTEAGGAGAGVQCWIGYSTTDATTSADFVGANWTWLPATFGSQQGNNDEFVAEIGSGLTPGSYYYVSRWQLGSGSYTYGGYNGGAWDGTANVSGSLTVDPLVIPACTQLFISEYVEGSSSNKYIELYNPTASPVDLTGYSVALYSNGSTSVTSSYEFSGTLNAYSTTVLRNSSANIYTGNATVDTGGTFFNGDDAIALSYNGTNIDVIGQIGVDPGLSWGGLTANTTLVRKSTVQAGDTDGSNAFDASVEWDAFPTDDVSNLGIHTSDCAPASLPTLSFSNATGLATLDYAQGSGPSGEGSITITLVDGDGTAVDVTAPSGFSISSTSGSGYVSTLSPVFSSNQTFTYNVTASSMMDYTISGTDRNGSVSGLDPSISISTGDTLSFEINAGPTHPFVISSVGTLPSNPIAGVTNNGATSGFVTWVPTVAGTYYYICDNHPNMVGTISVTDAYPSSGTATLYVIQNAGNPSGTNSGNLTAVGAGASSINQTVSGVVTVTYSFGPCAQLFISEYGEPSSGNGKYIEIYNPTNAVIDLANFELWKITNGGSWPEATLSLTGQIPSYGTFVIGNNQTDVPSADLTSGVLSFSGDDAVGLAWNGGSGTSYTLIDAVGEEGADPGSGWTVDGVTNATQNNVLVRKRTVDGPTTDWATSSTSEWIVLSYSQDSLDAHTSDCAPNLCANFTASAVVDSNVTCNGSFDGGATASASGGASPYSYLWSNSATTATITGVGSGQYTVTVSDDNGCSESASVSITEPVVVIAAALVDANVSTAGGSDGGATASATGGTSPYSYLWSNSATTASITGVVAGTYSVTVTDDNGCQSSSSVTITEPAVEVMDYYNLHFPAGGTINVGQSFDVYAQGYEPGVTEAAGAGTGVQCWIGYSTTDATSVADFTGSNWTWVAASFGSQTGNNDEFTLDLGANISTPGTYYYVSRWSLNGGTFTYGGTNSGSTSTGGGDAWDGTTFLSGILSVNGSIAPPCPGPFTFPFTDNFDNEKYCVTAGGEGTDGTADYFGRTNGTTPFPINQTYTNASGTFFAAQDIDDGGWAGSANPSQITWSGIDVTGQTDVRIAADYAANSGGLDISDYMTLEYSVDGGSTWNTVHSFTTGDCFNCTFQEDTDLNGLGDGTTLTTTFQTFTKDIVLSSATAMDLRLTIAANSGNEAVAVDNISVDVLPSNELPTVGNVSDDANCPDASTSVTVSADASDIDGSIATAVLNWGTATGSLGNAVSMTLSSGSTYTGVVPAQAAGTNVYYEVVVTDDGGATATSAESSYLVIPNAFTLPFADNFDAQNYCVTQGLEATDGAYDYFGRVTDVSIGNGTSGYSGFTGTNFFAAQDVDAEPGQSNPASIQWLGIDITGISSLDFSGDFASIAFGSGGPDATDSCLFEYSTDGGTTWNDLISFRSTASSNGVFAEDTDGDGVGDGTSLTSTMQNFRKTIAVSGTTLDLRVTVAAGTGSEDIAFDEIQLYETPIFTMDFVNLQFPASGTITAATNFDVFAQGYEAGVTEAAGAGAGVECWIGYSITDATTTSDFATGWTWESASYQGQGAGGLAVNNDEFTADIGTGITNAGTYYYVSRWRLNGGLFTYGGYNGGAWNGGSNVSGVLTVNPAPLPDLILNEIHADPSNAAGNVGDANGDGTAVFNEDEFIEIYNNEATSVDLAGYVIKDNGTMVHTFAATGSVLPAGGYAVVFGGGTPTNVSGDVVQVSSQGDLSLSNGGATISLENASGIEVFTYTYSGAGNNQSIARNPDLTGAFVDHTTIPAPGRLFSAGSVNVTAVCDLAISAVTVDANVSSIGGSDGALTVSTTGGTAPLSYAWTGGAITASITGLTAGTYVVTVTDDNGCLATDSATVTEPGPAIPIIELSIDNGNIEEGQTATVTATASGAVSSDETVTLAVTGVDATDYSLGSITILSGQTTGTATFTAVDDLDDEITEEAVIAISALSAGLDSGSIVSVKEYITDNDYATLTVPVSQSFESADTGSQYVDSMGLGSIDHDLYNFPGAQAIDYLSVGDLGFDASFEFTGSSTGLTDGDFAGVSYFTGTVGSYADGSQGYVMSDVDGVMAVEFDPVSLTGFASYAFDMDYYVQNTGYESSDSLHIYLVTDAGTLDLVRVDGDDIDNGVVSKGQWIAINQDLTGYTSAQLFIRFSSNSGSEAVYFDDINFTGSSSPTITASVNTLNFVGLVEGSSESTVETFTVTASNLTGDVTVTGVSGLEISLDGVSYSAGPLTISPTSGSISGATVYARVPNTVTAASGEPTGDIVLTATGATQVDVAVVATLTAPAADCSVLFFSEYIEGSGLNKCLEIYNPTSSAVSLADYTIGMFDGGATNMNVSRSFTFPATTSQSIGTLDVWVGCEAGAAADFLAVADSTFSFPSPLSYNGDDAITLMTPSGITVDIIGRIGEDPGTYWGSTVRTAEQTLVRLGSIKRGDSDGNDAFDPATEWESFPQNTYQTLGWHNSDCDPNNVAVWSGGAGSSDWSNNANWISGNAPTISSTRIVVPSNPVGGQVFPTYTGGTLTLGNTVVGSGASLNIGAGAVCQIGANATLASAGSIVLESDGSGTAMFDDFSQAGAIFYGSITMQQFVGGIVAAQHYVSSPVNNVPLTEWADDPQELSGYGAGLTGTDGVAVTPASNCSPDSISIGSNYGNLFQWDPETVINTFCPEQAGWVVRSQGNMEDGRGYSAYLAGGNSTLSITGAPNTGDVTYTMDAVGIIQNIPLSNWDILGNPYPSSLDRNGLITGNSGLNSPSYWNPSGTYSGTYQPYTPGSVIPSMQGFAANWNAGGSTAAVTYTNAMRSTTAGTWRSSTIDGDINIELRGNGYGDVTRIFFGEMMTSTFDALEDAYKFESAQGQPTLFTGVDMNMLSMNGRSNPVMGDQIALGVMPGQSGSFTLDFTSVAGLPYGSLLFLEDKSEGTWTQVAEGDVYAFTMTALDDYNRFVLHITPAVVVSAEDGDCSVSNGVLHVEAPSFTVEGQEVAWSYVISDAQGVVSTGVLSGAIEMPVHTTGNLTVNLANAYTSLTDVVYVETSLLPVVSLSDVTDEVGTSVSFVSPMTGEWIIDGVVISEGIDFVWTSLAAGTYELEFVGYTEFGCEVRTSCAVEMTDKVSSTNDVLLGQSHVLVTENYVRIVAHGSHTQANLYNMEGKVVASTMIAQAEAMLSIDGLATGVYTLSLEGSAQVESLQLFID